MAPLGRRRYGPQLRPAGEAEGSRRHYRLYGNVPLRLDGEPGTDIAAVAEGYISLTPLRFDLFAEDALAALGALLARCRMSYSTVIFDLDGTLIDTVPLIVASHRHALATVLGRELPEEELREGIGRPLLEQMRVFDEERAQELFDVYREFNHRVHDEYVTAFPGMLELCDDLRARGVPVAVATSKMLDAVVLAYGVVPGLEERIDAMVTIENTKTHKPGPEPIEHALELLGRPKQGAVYVGDAVSDMLAARAAGVAAVGVTWGAFSYEGLAAGRARRDRDDSGRAR